MARSEQLPTYAEIAKKAGVSPKTVCNVFRYPDVVRGKTEKRVLAALRALGVNDPLVMKSRLRPERALRTNSILLLESSVPAGQLSSPVFSLILRAAENRAHEQGWQFSIRYRNSTESLADAMRNFDGEGVLLFRNTPTYDELTLARPGMAAVRLLSPPEGGADCDNIDYDRLEVPRMAARHLQSLGCKSVGYIGGPETRGRLFLEAANALGMKTADGMVKGMFSTDENSQFVNWSSLQASWELIKTARPDGVFVYSDQITNAFYRLLAEKGIRPQRDIQIVSCNAEVLFLSPLHPRPATIDIHSAEIGRRGVDMLIWRIKNIEAPPSSVMIRPKLIPGEKAK